MISGSCHIIRAVALALLLVVPSVMAGQEPGTVRIGLLKYKGGGDWYANPTSLPNLADFCRDELGMPRYPVEEVEPGNPSLFNFPFVHMTGHGNVVFTPEEAQNLREWLIAGGFLHIDDNYGMDPFVRSALKQVFPELELVELPFDHPIYRQAFTFSEGLPKIHEHDGKPPQGFGLMWEGRLIVFYTYECDLGDGWEDPAVHNDPPEVHRAALEMGANILEYALTR